MVILKEKNSKNQGAHMQSPRQLGAKHPKPRRHHICDLFHPDFGRGKTLTLTHQPSASELPGTQDAAAHRIC
jgi:hypothetical protein